MTRIRYFPSRTVVTLLLLLLSLVLVANVAEAKPAKKQLVVDVAQNMTTFVPDEAPLHPDGTPAYGNLFIIQGYIYPEGTLADGNGIVLREDDQGTMVAEPEFPDKVIGRWTCRGWFVDDGLHTLDQAWAVTTQFFNLGDGFGDATIISQGYELPFGLDAELTRAITGGTGRYAGAGGEQKQWVVGLNATQAANFRIELNFDKKQ